MGFVSRLKSLVGQNFPTVTMVSGQTNLDIPDDTCSVNVTASATVTIGTINANRPIERGRIIYLTGATSTSAITLTNNTGTTTKGQMDLNGADITLDDRDVVQLIQRVDGSWDAVSGTVNEIDASELAFLDGVTAGTATANKALVVDASKGIGTITTGTITTLTSTTATITTGNVTTVNATNVDAGASGTAGTYDVFPTTAAKGKIQIAAADSAGDTTTTITNASQSGARTYTIPDAGASASFVMTEGTQTIAGAKTYTGNQVRATYTRQLTKAHAKVGTTAGWVLGAADNLPYMATMAASQSAGTLVVHLDNLHVGDTITGYKVVAQVESAGGTVTIDAALRAVTNVAADPTDAAIGTGMTQVSVTADTAVAQEKTGHTEVVTTGKTYYILITATTAGSTDIILQNVELAVTTA